MQNTNHSGIVKEKPVISFLLREKNDNSIKSYVKKQGGGQYLSGIQPTTLTCASLGTIIA